MRCIIYGPGAIGMSLAALLRHTGVDTRLVGRGENLRVIQEQGVTLTFPSGRVLRERVPATDRIEELAPSADDALFITLKSQQLPAVLEQMRAAAVPPSVPVFCFQNGVNNEARAATFFEHVYGVVLMFGATYLEPGQVRLEREGGFLEIGAYPEGLDERCSATAALFQNTGVRVSLNPRIMRARWGKLFRNLSNAIRAITDGDGLGSDLHRRVEAEAAAVLQAAGIDYEPAEEFRARTQALLPPLAPGAPVTPGSIWQSLMRGVSTEVDHFNGEIVRLGCQFGAPAPLNAALCHIIHSMEQSGRKPGLYSLEELSRRLLR